MEQNRTYNLQRARMILVGAHSMDFYMCIHIADIGHAHLHAHLTCESGLAGAHSNSVTHATMSVTWETGSKCSDDRCGCGRFPWKGTLPSMEGTIGPSTLRWAPEVSRAEAGGI